MKNIFKIFGLTAVLAVVATSCTGEDNTIDTVFDGVTNGAVLRTINVFANEIPIGDDTAFFSVEIEEQDNQEGALLESVDVFVTFADGSPDDGDSSGGTTAEVALRNIPASDFTPGPFGLPRTTITITVGEFLSAAGLTPDAIFGGDTFTTRLAVNLTDGRVFSVNNAGGIITGGFFNSPFQYVTPVVCPVGPDEFIGDYTVVNNSPGVLGFNVFAEGGTVTMVAGETSVDRNFDFIYLPDAGVGQPADTFLYQLVCNQVIVPPNQSTNLTCGTGLTIGPAPSGDVGSYTTGDDSVFTIIFTDNVQSDCGEGPMDVMATFTKQ